MNKLVLSILILAMVSSCKKESKTEELSEYSAIDSVTTPESNEVSETVIPFKKVELSPDETSKMLAKQNNDTLYITNFFATWCGPCMQEIPHFKEKMKEMKDQPVKFTFVNLDAKEDWDTKVKAFAEENNLSENIVLVDGEQLIPEYFHANFKEWDGGSIPFTLLRKGDKTDENIGMMSKEMLDQKISSFLSSN